MTRPLNIHHCRGNRKLSWTVRLAPLLVAAVFELGQVVELEDVLVVVRPDLEARTEHDVRLDFIEGRGRVEPAPRRRVRRQRLAGTTHAARSPRVRRLSPELRRPERPYRAEPARRPFELRGPPPDRVRRRRHLVDLGREPIHHRLELANPLLELGFPGRRLRDDRRGGNGGARKGWPGRSRGNWWRRADLSSQVRSARTALARRLSEDGRRTKGRHDDDSDQSRRAPRPGTKVRTIDPPLLKHPCSRARTPALSSFRLSTFGSGKL